MLKAEAGKSYDNYGTIAQELMGALPEARKMSAAEQDRLQRERLNSVLGEVAKVLEKLNDDDDDEDGPHRMTAPVMTGPSADRITTAVVGVAKKIEDNVRKVVTSAAAAVPT